ncbi:Arylsulfatase [Rosistilla ulvae]|uniref:Arylsulfatase n=1 Tax=Rosistilla ulvae TaxID=1930277 RepID=A0A517LZ39_9BACT|nr:sulfatase [Rosistilla ulvae]QDS87893.1 Arylsulfatase [Rosistilla ulvae]
MIRSTVRCLFLALCFSPCIVNAADARPNVIVFIADDVSWNDFGCYGNPQARTPNIDRLAAGGLRLDQAYLTASSCSPSRASMITGRYPHNNGPASELHLPIAANLPWFPERLRDAGYYTALSGKNHMSVGKLEPGQSARPKAFDLIDRGRNKNNGGGHANWVRIAKDRPRDKPFFFWYAAYDAHRAWDGDRQWDAKKYGPRHTPESVRVPKFLVDDLPTRQDLASYYNEVTRFDYFVGEVVQELAEQKVLDNTLILVLADNGRPFPRAKTRLHDSGMKTALVAHWPATIKPGEVSDSLVSAIDIAPTVLSVAGAEIPETVQGVSMLPLFSDPSATIRRYAFSEHNWHDFEAHGRSIRDGRFLFIQNNRPQFPWQGPADSVNSPSHEQLRLQRDGNKLTAAQQDVFTAPRPAEELYLVDADPDQLNNLIDDKRYAADADRLRKLLDEWSVATGDTVPDQISSDSFDRETGDRLPIAKNAFRGTPAGTQRNATTVNNPGPR